MHYFYVLQSLGSVAGRLEISTRTRSPLGWQDSGSAVKEVLLLHHPGQSSDVHVLGA